MTTPQLTLVPLKEQRKARLPRITPGNEIVMREVPVTSRNSPDLDDVEQEWEKEVGKPIYPERMECIEAKDLSEYLGRVQWEIEHEKHTLYVCDNPMERTLGFVVDETNVYHTITLTAFKCSPPLSEDLAIYFGGTPEEVRKRLATVDGRYAMIMGNATEEERAFYNYDEKQTDGILDNLKQLEEQWCLEAEADKPVYDGSFDAGPLIHEAPGEANA